MTLELLQDMQSPNNPDKIWRKGQIIDLGSEDSERYIKEGKAALYPVAKIEATEQVSVAPNEDTEIEK